jgi:ribose transport system substrate-binding protein
MFRNKRLASSAPGRHVAAASVALAITLVLTACGGAGKGATSDTTKGTTDPAVITGAKKLVADATAGMVYAPKPENQISLADWQRVTEWVGPKSTPAPPKGKKVYVVACAAVAPFCNDVAQGAVDAAKAVGWDATFLDGKGTPQGFAAAFQTALAGNPDAIITMAVPESAVGTYLAQARAKDIKTIGISSIAESGTPAENKYDAYVSARENPNAQLQAWWTIADSNGQAKVGYIWDPAFPFLVEALDASKKIFAQCSGCVIKEVVNSDIPTLADPTKAQQLAESLLQRHPDIEYVILPYGIGTRSVIEAGKSLGRDIRVVNKNSDPVNVGLVNEGLLAQENGTSPTMAGWAGIDQTIRVLAGAKALADWEFNLPIHQYIKSNTPAKGTYDWESETDYKTQYLRLWGISR